MKVASANAPAADRSWICRLCFSDVPSGNKCDGKGSIVNCKEKRHEGQGPEKPEPKPALTHTKEASEILNAQDADK